MTDLFNNFKIKKEKEDYQKTYDVKITKWIDYCQAPVFEMTVTTKSIENIFREVLTYLYNTKAYVYTFLEDKIVLKQYKGADLVTVYVDIQIRE